MILFAAIALVDLFVIVWSTITVPAGRLAVDLLIFVVLFAPLVAAGSLYLIRHEAPLPRDKPVGSRR